ncbi:hypothetical protein DMB66_03740 [Actinoplanes sp. ATCC 53533]|uniref:trypsin-like peptidase domain-containing protein n=1 Tax=Actinoplanes sp. ATCC 53533 TaxID=1288362 RepID=UPI000F79444D|nr:trypsin-like peptidase domain-containing protein [Actinoplanes sp. ATCC 53533]RSM73152.1 hypothetical protein DMB66_03740 [Actinoplanes sp. ATCC 53533]
MLEDFPYPWHEKWAQRLHRTLTQLFPGRQPVQDVVARAGIDLTEIDTDGAVAHIWWRVLDYAGRTGQVRDLVTAAADRLPAGSPRRRTLDDLLLDRPVSSDGEPRGTDGAPRFLHATDDVLEHEARLYHDDLTLQIGRVPALIATLQRLFEHAPAVCKLTVAIGPEWQEGTAFRIGSDLLLTNWHVVHSETNGGRATRITAEFGYEDDGDGGLRTATTLPCDVATVTGDVDDDWAVVRAPLDDRWPIIALDGAVEPTEHSAAYIIQHPDGQRKRLGFVRNQVSYVGSRVIHYLTDTETGSSGSPVFDASGALIAVHHAGGRPQEVLGKPPAKKNEGIRIPRIVAGLTAAGIRIG